MSDLHERWRGRAAATFERRENELQEALTAMLAQFSSKGRLGSGAAARAGMKLFEEHTRGALDEVLSEASNLIEHRGRAWRAAMRGIGEALNAHLAAAPEKLSRVAHLSGARGSPSAMEQLTRELAGMNERLDTHLADFRDGWTAPVAKPWSERHRFVYAVGLMLVGAVVAAMVKAALSASRLPTP
jgi:plasmid stability protein